MDRQAQGETFIEEFERYSPIYYVYGLRDPLKGKIGYVGITSSPKTRLQTHWSRRRKAQDALAVWLRALEVEGVYPVASLADVRGSKHSAACLTR
jgi:hypothetical protein